MPKAVVSKRVLDTLIRAKAKNVAKCRDVHPLPVAWRKPKNGGCNWHIPGWTGESGAVNECVEQMRQYLQFLRDQFDIPENE